MTHRIVRTVSIAMIFMVTAAVDGFAISSLHSSRTSPSSQLGAFVGRRGGGRRSNKSSPLVDEALAVYPFRFQPDKKQAGAPEGEKLYAPVTRNQATGCFNELARLYGDDEALAMVKLLPRALSFRSDFFEPCLEAWTEQFGSEAAQGMVRRNPGLLGVNPILAREPAEASMALSYVVAVTRPLPKLIAAGLLLSIATAGLR